jgi:hypothetical protein
MPDMISGKNLTVMTQIKMVDHNFAQIYILFTHLSISLLEK